MTICIKRWSVDPMSPIDKIDRSIEKLMRYLEGTGWAGYDPYDALNSPLLSRISSRSKWCRIAFTQALKLSPINIRPFVGVPKGINPKGLGLFLCAYLKHHERFRDPASKQAVEILLRMLNATRSPGYHGPCWGYNFDWQSRVGFSPKTTPTLVNTAFVAHSYLDAFEHLGDSRLLDVAMGAARFMLQDLNVTRENGLVCFSYTPFDRTRVVNANALGAGFLARLYTWTRKREHLDFASRLARYVAKRQNPDGSWYYADTSFQRWIDSHHTGFVLEGLFNYIHYSGDNEWLPALKRGLAYYRDHFFGEDGHPSFYNDRAYPVDIHCPSQALVTLSRLRSVEDHTALALKVSDWMIDHLQDPRGFFYYRIERHFTNKIPYIRWGQAWAFHGLTTFRKYGF